MNKTYLGKLLNKYQNKYHGNQSVSPMESNINKTASQKNLKKATRNQSCFKKTTQKHRKRSMNFSKPNYSRKSSFSKTPKKSKRPTPKQRVEDRLSQLRIDDLNGQSPPHNSNFINLAISEMPNTSDLSEFLKFQISNSPESIRKSKMTDFQISEGEDFLGRQFKIIQE